VPKVAEFRIDGVKELAAGLRSLPRQVQRSGLRKAVTPAATPIVKAAKSSAPKQTGLLKKSLTKKIQTYKRTDTVVAVIGARADAGGEYKGRRRVPAKYAHLVEQGHGGPHPASAKPFLKPAFEANKGNALRIMAGKLAEFILTAAARLANRK
jgi:HK97 gp10 family phage protein